MPYLLLTAHCGKVKTKNGLNVKTELPKGCLGISFIFDTKEHLMDWQGDRPGALIEVEIGD